MVLDSVWFGSCSKKKCKVRFNLKFYTITGGNIQLTIINKKVNKFINHNIFIHVDIDITNISNI